MTGSTHRTIRCIVVAAAVVVCIVLILLTIRYNIESSHDVQTTCIEQGGSWVGGQCIQVPGGRS